MQQVFNIYDVFYVEILLHDMHGNYRYIVCDFHVVTLCYETNFLIYVKTYKHL
jgi:hypothetical protein